MWESVGSIVKPLCVYEKQKKLHCEIHRDAYAKRTAGRVAATPASQGDRINSASRTTRAGTPVASEQLNLVVGALAWHHHGSTNPSDFWTGNPPPAHLKPSTESPIMDHQIHTYSALLRQIHNDLRVQHPDWIQPNGDSPLCDSYEARLMKLLDASRPMESNEKTVRRDFEHSYGFGQR
jgi:hypothetical protein